MQDTSKLMLTIVAGGVLLGLWVGQLSSPVMQFAAQPEWRDRLQPSFSSTPLQFANAGPEDLRPFGPAPGIVPAAYAREVTTTLPISPRPVRHGAPIAKELASEPALLVSLPEPTPSPQPDPFEVADPDTVPEQ